MSVGLHWKEHTDHRLQEQNYVVGKEGTFSFGSGVVKYFKIFKLKRGIRTVITQKKQQQRLKDSISRILGHKKMLIVHMP